MHSFLRFNGVVERLEEVPAVPSRLTLGEVAAHDDTVAPATDPHDHDHRAITRDRGDQVRGARAVLAPRRHVSSRRVR